MGSVWPDGRMVKFQLMNNIAVVYDDGLAPYISIRYCRFGTGAIWGTTSGTTAIAILGTPPVRVSRLFPCVDRRDLFEILKVGGEFPVPIQLTRNSEVVCNKKLPPKQSQYWFK